MFDMLNSSLIGAMSALVDEASTHGASYFPKAIKMDARMAVAEEVSRQCEFKALHNIGEEAPVVEDMEICKIPVGHPRFTMLTGLSMQLAQLANAFLEIRGRGEWVPNQAAVHRYHAGSQALGAHRDFSSDELLIAVITLRGSSVFELLEDDRTTVRASFTCDFGDLCLMRAPGLTDAEDDRPYHRVLAPDEYFRESLILRQINWEREVRRTQA